ncbi:MAG: hypothetical protein U0M06_02910 [Clostridia bacterium]|nr:hypothetical protein [Clostridia bacterium]
MQNFDTQLVKIFDAEKAINKLTNEDFSRKLIKTIRRIYRKNGGSYVDILIEAGHLLALTGNREIVFERYQKWDKEVN